MLHRTAIIPIRRNATNSAGQSQLVEAADSYAATLNELIDSLHNQATVPAGRFSNLVRRIVLDVTECTSPDGLLFQPGFSLRGHLRRSFGIDRGPVLADGVQAALLAAALATTDPLEPDQAEVLVIAALLHHVGLLSLVRGCRLPLPILLKEKAEVCKQHPQFGAALAGAIRHASTLPVQLIAEHHERLDGTGYPRGLTDREMSPLSQRLTLICRAVELADPAVAQSTNKRHGVVLDEQHAAAVILHREAQQGEFDAGLTSKLLDLLGFELRATGALDQDQRRIDAAHNGIPAAHHRPVPEESPHEHLETRRAIRAHEKTSQEKHAVPRPHFLGPLRHQPEQQTTAPRDLFGGDQWVHNED